MSSIDYFCSRKRCQKKEQKESKSTLLQFIKSWKMTGKGGVWTETGLFECPNCGARYRKHIASGRETN